MRCQRWPDDRCRSPQACSDFGYCRERNWDARGYPLDAAPFAADWRRQDDDGQAPGFSYEAAHAAR